MSAPWFTPTIVGTKKIWRRPVVKSIPLTEELRAEILRQAEANRVHSEDR